MKHKIRPILGPFITLFLLIYGIVSVYRDWLHKPMIAACSYIDGMGAVFWVCLLVAGVVVWIADRMVRNGEQEGRP